MAAGISDAGVYSYGYVDSDLNWVIEPQFEYCNSYHLTEFTKTDRYDFHDGLAAFFDSAGGEYGLFGYIDKTGQIQILAQCIFPLRQYVKCAYLYKHRRCVLRCFAFC